MPKIQLGADGYRIVGDNGEEGDITDYGSTSTLDEGDEHFSALVDLDKEEEPKTCLAGGAWLMNVTTGEKVMKVEMEEVDFEGEEFEDDEEEEEEDDDDDDLVADEPDEDEDDEDSEDEGEETEELKS